MKRCKQLTDLYQLVSSRFALAVINRDLRIPAKQQNQLLIIIGLLLLVGGLTDFSFALRTTQYNDQRLTEAINAVLSYLEGSFGALVMVCAGVGAILSAAFGQYRASLGLLVVAIGSFILRSLIGTFFNDVGIQE